MQKSSGKLNGYLGSVARIGAMGITTSAQLPNTKCGIRGLWHLSFSLSLLMLLLASEDGFRRVSKQLLYKYIYVCV